MHPSARPVDDRPVIECTRRTGSDVVAGGTAEWQAAGLPLEQGPEHLSTAPTDVYKRPYEGTDNAVAAMQAYLERQYGLVAQLEHHGTHIFRVDD
jgi:hypothetical protein